MRKRCVFGGLALALWGASYLHAQEAKTEDKKPADKPAEKKTDEKATKKPAWSPFSALQSFKIIAAIDEDLDGTITMKEIESSVERIQKLDVDGDGKLSTVEYLREGDINKMVAGFGVVKGLDADKDGSLSAEEIKVAVDVLKKLDGNKNNRLESNEYAMKTPMSMGGGGGGGGPGGPGGPGGGGGGRGGPGGPGGGRQMPSPEEVMKQNDKNSDGKLEKSEVSGPMADFFDRMDENKDGGITLEEIKAARERRQQGGGRGGPGGPGAGGPGAPAGSGGESKPDAPKGEAPQADAPK